MARNRRWRKLIILRGMPGSGKTRLARRLTENDIGAEIFSADDYYQRDERGNFLDVQEHLQEAHRRNREQVFDAVRRGVSTIVVDNTNLQKWEMWPYMQMGFWHGYFITIEEIPDDVSLEILFERNNGRLSMRTLRNMQARYARVKRFWEVLYSRGCWWRWMKRPEGQENHGWR